MKTHSIILNTCLVISSGCLIGGYILSGYWLIVPALLAMTIFWLITKNKSTFWSASSLFLIYVFMAALGVIINLSILLMTTGCITALAWWDLTHFEQSINSNPSSKIAISLERHHLQSLALVIFISFVLTFVSSNISLRFSFGVISVFLLIAIGCLTYGIHHILRN